jgi:hypothetical protein
VASIGLLSRLKLTEPVRLYLYSLAVVAIGGLALAGVLTGQWIAYATGAVAVVLSVTVGGEAARASVYSPRSVVQAVRRAADR